MILLTLRVRIYNRSGEGQHILVYVNAQTGQEEKILILLEDESGTLVI